MPMDNFLKELQDRIAEEGPYVPQRFIDSRDVTALHKALIDIEAELAEFSIENHGRPVSVDDFEGRDNSQPPPRSFVTKANVTAWLSERGYTNFNVRLDRGCLVLEPLT